MLLAEKVREVLKTYNKNKTLIMEYVTQSFGGYFAIKGKNLIDLSYFCDMSEFPRIDVENRLEYLQEAVKKLKVDKDFLCYLSFLLGISNVEIMSIEMHFDDTIDTLCIHVFIPVQDSLVEFLTTVFRKNYDTFEEQVLNEAELGNSSGTIVITLPILSEFNLMKEEELGLISEIKEILEKDGFNSEISITGNNISITYSLLESFSLQN